MKTRIGFVSNSSSSSFCIYGAQLDDSISSDDMEEQHMYEFMRSKGLVYECGPYGEIYVGRSWTSIGDDETGGQFKKSIQDAVAECWPDKKCRTHEEGWYDG